jgi:hypothetical protein
MPGWIDLGRTPASIPGGLRGMDRTTDAFAGVGRYPVDLHRRARHRMVGLNPARRCRHEAAQFDLRFRRDRDPVRFAACDEFVDLAKRARRKCRLAMVDRAEPEIGGGAGPSAVIPVGVPGLPTKRLSAWAYSSMPSLRNVRVTSLSPSFSPRRKGPRPLNSLSRSSSESWMPWLGTPHSTAWLTSAPPPFLTQLRIGLPPRELPTRSGVVAALNRRFAPGRPPR